MQRSVLLRTLLVGVVLTLESVSPSRAQELEQSPVGSLLPRQQSAPESLQEIYRQLASAWEARDARAVTRLARGGRVYVVIQRDGVNQRLAATQDAYTRQQLEETRQALAERQQHARDLETYVGRILAQLQNISASLDNVLAETVRLRTADAVSADTATNQVAQRLSDLKSDMDAFQLVLDTAMTQTGAA